MSLGYPSSSYREPDWYAAKSKPEDTSDWGIAPRILTRPHHHYCEVFERPDIEARLHSSALTMAEGSMKLNGRGNRARLCQVLANGPGRWVHGGRQPAEVAPGQLVYLKERTVAFRVHLRKQNHYYVAMDAVMAELDQQNLRLRPVGQFIVVRETEERARQAVMGDLPFFMHGGAMDLEKKGAEADDIGCNTYRFGEVVSVGPGKFGGFIPMIVDLTEQAVPSLEGREMHGVGRFRTIMQPYWETIDCKIGDLVVFTDLARPTEITLAGRKYVLFEWDHSVCSVLDGVAG
jgi:co-chaperonin GroES (HSP10)